MKLHHIKYLILIITLTAVSSCLVINPEDSAMNNNYSAEEDFSREITVQNQTQLSIQAVNGDVLIKGRANLTTVTISGKKVVKSDSKSDARDHLESLDVLISEKSSEIIVKTEQPGESGGRTYMVCYEIWIPIHWQVIVSNVNGKIQIDSLQNSVIAGLVNGDICLCNIEGSAVASVTNGKIEAHLKLPLNGNCKLSTVNGAIQLCIPQNTSAKFTANVVNGTIRINDLHLGNLTNTTRSVIGVLGSGEGDITISSLNGTIVVDGYAVE